MCCGKASAGEGSKCKPASAPSGRSIQDRQIMRLGHALLSVFVRKDRGSGSVKRRVVVGMVEVPVAVNDAFHWCIAQAIESLFEPGPGRRNESVHDEFAVGAVKDYHASAGAVEHSDIVSKLLRFQGNGVELGTHIREQVGRPKALVARGPLRRRGATSQERGAPERRCRLTWLNLAKCRGVRFASAKNWISSSLSFPRLCGIGLFPCHTRLETSSRLMSDIVCFVVCDKPCK